MGSETRNIDNNVSPPNKNKHSISPYQKQFQLPLNKTNKIPTYQLFLTPPFCHVLTKITQTKSNQKTYATKVKRKSRIKGTQNNLTL